MRKSKKVARCTNYFKHICVTTCSYCEIPMRLSRRLCFLFLFLLFPMVGGYTTAYAFPPLKMTEAYSYARVPNRGAGWQQLSVTNAPPARRDAAMGYDAARHRLILFGGRSGSESFDDTWALDLNTLVWQPLATGTAVRPDARHSMVSGVDSIGNRFLVTTGQQASTLFNDVWSLDLTTDTWVELPPQGAVPDIRYGSAGGIAPGSDSLFLSHGFTNEGRFDDTRRFDLATNTWHNVTPDTTRPLPRCLHAATLTQGDNLVLFGGCASGFGPCPLNDTWIFEESTGSWSEISTPADVEARLFPSIISLGESNEVLLFGGETGGNALGDGWLLDIETRQWVELSTNGESPEARAGHTMVWVPTPTGVNSGGVLLFGGQAGSTDFNDLWLFTPQMESSPFPFSVSLPLLRSQ
jgi:hypothetical protein